MHEQVEGRSPTERPTVRPLQESRTLGELLLRQALEQPHATALIFRERRTSYSDLNAYANQVANGLLGLAVPAGTRVGYLGQNSDFYFNVLFGAAKAGVALVPVNWRLAPPEIAAILANADAALLFVGRGFGDVAAALSLPRDCHYISVDGASDHWPDFATWRDAQSTAEPMAPLNAEATVVQMYTSGTTGLPKGVELTNRSLIAVLRAAEEGGFGALGRDDVALMCMPAFHIAGTNVGLIGFGQGASVVIVEEYNPAVVADLIPQHRVTFILLVPAAILLLVQHPKTATADFSSVRILAYGASPIAETLVEEARAAFANAGLWHLYGLTEASGGGTISPPSAHDPGLGKLRSCGKPYPGFELRIVDPLGEDVPTGEVGEIVLRSPTLMKGYWNNPEETRAALTGDGWLRTGDAAYMDADGFIYVHDRIKDMIITGGENVFPAEVENALFSHPGVADVAVIGVPDPRWGESVKAFVVRRSGLELTADAIIAHARERIAGFKVPKSVEFVEVLPRNAAGKLLRRTLRAPYWEGHHRLVG